MAICETFLATEWQLLPSRSYSDFLLISSIPQSHCVSALRMRFKLKYVHSSLGYNDKTKPWPEANSRSSMTSVQSRLCRCELPQARNSKRLAASQQNIFCGGTRFGIICPSQNLPGAAAKPGLTVELKDRGNQGLRKGRRRTKLKDQIEEVFQRAGLERQFGQLPKWSAYVPVIAAGLETMVIVSWSISLKGDLQGSSLFNLSGEGLLTLILGINFMVGWLASQMSTWSMQALSPGIRGANKRVASPGVLEFIRAFAVNLIPYGNFLAWTRLAWKENSTVSSVNALVYVVPSLLKLVLWSQGLTLGGVEQVAWILGAIHRPFDAVRVQNEKVLAVANEKSAAAKKSKEEKEQQGKDPELTADEMVFLQQRKELEEFDILLARSANGTTSIPGIIQDWSVGDTIQWLGQEGFARYASTFAENDIDGTILLHLTPDDLRDDLGIQSLGDRKKLGQAIERLKTPTSRENDLPND